MIIFPLAVRFTLLNIRLIWLSNGCKPITIVHSQSDSIFIILYHLYLLFVGNWLIAGSLLVVTLVLWFYVMNEKTAGVNWDFLIHREEKTLEKVYKFIHLYIDVPQLKYSFKPRRLLGGL